MGPGVSCVSRGSVYAGGIVAIQCAEHPRVGEVRKLSHTAVGADLKICKYTINDV